MLSFSFHTDSYNNIDVYSGIVIPILSAFIAAWVAFKVLRWQFDSQIRSEQVEKLNRYIIEISDISSEYWLLSGNRANRQKIIMLEAKIMGIVESIESQSEQIKFLFRKIDIFGIDILWGQFFDCVSGGDFSNPTRKPDIERCRKVQLDGAKLMSEYNKAYLNKYFQ